jgi:hypothetical protein
MKAKQSADKTAMTTGENWFPGKITRINEASGTGKGMQPMSYDVRFVT